MPARHRSRHGRSACDRRLRDPRNGCIAHGCDSGFAPSRAGRNCRLGVSAARLRDAGFTIGFVFQEFIVELRERRRCVVREIGR